MANENNQLLKGLPGTPALQGDLDLTDTDQTTSLFKVTKSSGNTTVKGSLTFGAAAAKARGTLSVNVTSAGTAADTAATDLMTYSLPAGTLATNGQGVRIRAWGSTGANVNNKTVKLQFGATDLISSGALAANNKDWFLEAVVIRSGATAQVAWANGQANGALIQTSATAPAETLANAITIAMEGTNGTAAANDIVCKGMTVELLS